MAEATARTAEQAALLGGATLADDFDDWVEEEGEKEEVVEEVVVEGEGGGRGGGGGTPAGAMSAAASHEALFAHRVHRAADAARVAELWPLDAHVQTETVPPSETPASDDGYRLPIGGNASADGAHMGQDPSPPRVSPKRARVVDAAAAAEDEEMPRAMAGSAGGRMAPGAGGALTAWETGGGGDAEGIAAGRRVRPGRGGGGADDASGRGLRVVPAA